MRLDDTEVPGVLSTVGYIDGRRQTPSEIAALIQTKVQGKKIPKKPALKTPAAASGRRVNWTHMTVMRKLRKAVNDPDIIGLLDQLAARPSHSLSFDELRRHANIIDVKRGKTALGVLTKTIKREFDLSPEKMSLPYERPHSADGSGQTNYRMAPEVAHAWLKSADRTKQQNKAG